HYDGQLVPTTAPFQTALAPGWNMIGDPFPAAVPVSTLTAGGASVTSGAVVSPTLFRYDTSTGLYAALNPATDALQPYQGYWIYAAQAATLSFPAP
ncbi:MAG: hypothetical protein M3Y56_04600, partial [Armatimonadota bacterium]|nr:hypothetical protein [Armatimonadota bacterium]